MDKYNITKDTVVDILTNLQTKGLYYTQSVVDNKIREIPDKSIYRHIAPTWQSLSRFLHTLEEEHKDLFTERITDEGPINQGEYWGTFVDLFPINNKELYPLYNDFIDTISFGVGIKFKTVLP
jgi:hypothetical protein